MLESCRSEVPLLNCGPALFAIEPAHVLFHAFSVAQLNRLPLSIKSKCPYPRCMNARPCPTHRPRENRPSSTARGYGYRWQQYVAFYKQNHQLCRPCEQKGITRSVYAVDHIVPISSQDDERFWDENNHQPICQRCHAAKSAKEKAIGTTRYTGGDGKNFFPSIV